MRLSSLPLMQSSIYAFPKELWTLRLRETPTYASMPLRQRTLTAGAFKVGLIWSGRSWNSLIHLSLTTFTVRLTKLQTIWLMQQSMALWKSLFPVRHRPGQIWTSTEVKSRAIWTAFKGIVSDPGFWGDENYAANIEMLFYFECNGSCHLMARLFYQKNVLSKKDRQKCTHFHRMFLFWDQHMNLAAPK